MNIKDKRGSQFQLNYANALKSVGILKKAGKENFMDDIDGWIKNNPNILTAILGGLGGVTGGALGKGPGALLGLLAAGALGHQAPRLWGDKPADLLSSEEWVGTDTPEKRVGTDTPEKRVDTDTPEKRVDTDTPESTDDISYEKLRSLGLLKSLDRGPRGPQGPWGQQWPLRLERMRGRRSREDEDTGLSWDDIWNIAARGRKIEIDNSASSLNDILRMIKEANANEEDGIGAENNFMDDIGGWVKNNPNILTAILAGLGGLGGGAISKSPLGTILGALLMGGLGHQAPRLWGGKPADLFNKEEWVGADAPEFTDDTGDTDDTDDTYDTDDTDDTDDAYDTGDANDTYEEPPVPEEFEDEDTAAENENTEDNDFNTTKRFMELVRGYPLTNEEPSSFEKVKNMIIPNSRRDEDTAAENENLSSRRPWWRRSRRDNSSHLDEIESPWPNETFKEKKEEKKEEGKEVYSSASSFDSVVKAIKQMQKKGTRTHENAQNAFGQRGLPAHGKLISTDRKIIDDKDLVEKAKKAKKNKETEKSDIIDDEKKVTKASSSFLNGFFKALDK